MIGGSYADGKEECSKDISVFVLETFVVGVEEHSFWTLPPTNLNIRLSLKCFLHTYFMLTCDQDSVTGM